MVSGQLLANTEIPGLTVEYSMDGVIWKKVGLAEMVPEDKKIMLRTMWVSINSAIKTSMTI